MAKLGFVGLGIMGMARLLLQAGHEVARRSYTSDEADQLLQYGRGIQLYCCGHSEMGRHTKLSQNLIIRNLINTFNEAFVLRTKAGVAPEPMLKAAARAECSYSSYSAFTSDFACISRKSIRRAGHLRFYSDFRDFAHGEVKASVT